MIKLSEVKENGLYSTHDTSINMDTFVRIIYS